MSGFSDTERGFSKLSGLPRRVMRKEQPRGRMRREAAWFQGALDVILEEGSPRLRRRLPAPHHVPADAGLSDLDTELEQFAVNTRRTPERILPAQKV